MRCAARWKLRSQTFVQLLAAIEVDSVHPVLAMASCKLY